MKRQIHKAVILLAVSAVIMLIGGCGEQGQDISQSDAAKIDRLTGAENRQLRKEAEKLKKEKEELAKSLQDERASAEKSRKSGEERLQNLSGAAAEEKSKLEQQYKEARAQVRQLKEKVVETEKTKQLELMVAAEENSKLNQKIEGLEAQVKQLEEELEPLRSEEKYKKWQEETQKKIDDLTNSTIKDLEENGRLNEENNKLKTEIEELKKELETLKASASTPDKG